MKTQKEQERTRCISCNRRIGGEGKPNKYGVCSNCHHKYFDGSEKHIRFLINLWKTAELKGIKEGKVQTLADVMKIIEHEIDYEKNFMMSGFKVRTSVKLLEELKAKLQSPQKENKEVKSCLFVAPNGDTNIQKAISEFKEKLKERVLDNLETHKRYGKSTIESRMRFNDILKDINKTAQEIK